MWSDRGSILRALARQTAAHTPLDVKKKQIVAYNSLCYNERLKMALLLTLNRLNCGLNQCHKRELVLQTNTCYVRVQNINDTRFVY